MIALHDRRGFALPLAIMIIAILSAAIAAGFAATASESVVNNAQRAQERAYQIAQAGLQQFMVRRSEVGFCTGCAANPATADSEYTRVSLNGGYADVVAYSVRKEVPGSKSALYFIRSKGVDTAARLSGAGNTTYAERTVGVYAKWNATTMVVLGALTTFNGVTRTGGTIDGQENCATSTLPNLPTDVVAVALSGNIPGGGPSIDSLSTSTLGELDTLQAIDWDGIINKNQLKADVTIMALPWPAINFTNWPIIRVKTSAAGILPLSVVGQGIIIADSDFTIPKTPDWKGIILVGGKLITTATGGGTSIVRGAVVTGLNRLLAGGSAPAGVTGDNDTWISSHTIRYNSCNVATAGQSLHWYAVMPNTWMDNVAAW